MAGRAQELIGLGFSVAGGALVNTHPQFGYPIMAIGVLLMIWGVSVAYREWKKTGKRVLEPSQIILFGLLGAAFCLIAVAGGYAWQLHETKAATAPAAPLAVSTQAALTPKSYPQVDRERLAEFFASFSDMLLKNGANGGGDGLWYRVAMITNNWQNYREALSKGNKEIISKIKSQLEDAAASVAQVRAELYYSNFRQRYPDEFDFIVGNSEGRDKLSILYDRVIKFEQDVDEISYALEHGDKRIIDALTSALQEKVNEILKIGSEVQKMEFGIYQRCEDFRKSLRQ